MTTAMIITIIMMIITVVSIVIIIAYMSLAIHLDLAVPGLQSIGASAIALKLVFVVAMATMPASSTFRQRLSREGRRPRSKVETIDVRKMYEDLKGVASMNVASLPFKWDGTHYTKKRGDAEGSYQLSMSAPVLDILVKHCRSGSPSLPQLRNVIVALEADYKILKLKDGDDLFTESHNAADMWRILCRHVRG